MTRLAPYQPPAIPKQVLVGLVVAFAVFSLARGLDYVVGDDEHVQSLVVLTALGHLEVWGWLITVAASNVLVCYLLLRRHFLVWLSHVLMAALYLCISVTITQSVVLAGDGWSDLAGPAGTFAWHLTLLVLTRPFPRSGAGRGA